MYAYLFRKALHNFEIMLHYSHVFEKYKIKKGCLKRAAFKILNVI